MADNVGFTAGAGTNIKTDQDAGDSSHMQVVKLATSGDGVGTLIPATVANGMTVDVTRVSGVVHVDDNAASLTVDAPVGTPVFVRLSDGAAPITALPITDNAGSITVDGAVTVSGTVAATQSGTWNVGTLTTITNVVHMDDNGGSITVDGTVAVTGTVTANQGTAAALANAWPAKISDGADFVGITDVAGAKALKVDVVQTTTLGTQTDRSAFTDGTGKVGVVGGVYNEAQTDPTEDQAAALRVTLKRALHVNLRKADATELGVAAAPVRTDPTGTTAQPITDNAGSLTVDAPVGTPVFIRLSDGAAPITALPITDNSGLISIDDGAGSITVDGTVTANQGGAPWTVDVTKIAGTAIVAASAGIAKVGISDEVGANLTDTNPLPVSVVGLDRTQLHNAAALTASQTAVALWTPGGSKKFVCLGFTLTATVAGVLTLYDGTDSALFWMFKGTVPVGINQISFGEHGFISAAINNVLRYTSGTGLVCEIQIHGYESA